MIQSKSAIYGGTLLALDTASRNTGYAVYKGGKIVCSGVWRLKRESNLFDLYRHVTETIRKYGVSQIVAEDIYKSPDVRNAYERLAECRGVVQLCNQAAQLGEVAFISSIRVCSLLWNYNQHRTYYKQFSRADKKLCTINYLVRLGYLPSGEKSDDRADAIALLLAWLQIHRFQFPTI